MRDSAPANPEANPGGWNQALKFQSSLGLPYAKLPDSELPTPWVFAPFPRPQFSDPQGFAQSPWVV
jgi:hypothetical protein